MSLISYILSMPIKTSKRKGMCNVPFYHNNGCLKIKIMKARAIESVCLNKI